MAQPRRALDAAPEPDVKDVNATENYYYNLRQARDNLVVFSMDVVALYPSIVRDMAMKAVEKAITETDIAWDNVDDLKQKLDEYFGPQWVCPELRQLTRDLETALAANSQPSDQVAVVGYRGKNPRRQ